jgi:hypothetical protein
LFEALRSLAMKLSERLAHNFKGDGIAALSESNGGLFDLPESNGCLVDLSFFSFPYRVIPLRVNLCLSSHIFLLFFLLYRDFIQSSSNRYSIYFVLCAPIITLYTLFPVRQ